MNRLKHLILLLFIASLSFSCKKEINAMPPEVDNLSAKVDGSLFLAGLITAQLYTTEKTMQVSGTKGNEGFTLMLSEYKGLGEYKADELAICAYVSNPNDPFNANFIGVTGKVTITKATDKIIAGTFEFNGQNLMGNSIKTITEGKFSVNYSKL